MRIDSLKLIDFRNFSRVDVGFHEHTTVFVGNNGEGKTNLLESVYFLTTGRSFRVKDEQRMIRTGKNMSKIVGVFEDDKIKHTVTAVLHPQGKTILFNKTPVLSIKNHIGKIHTVLFSPMDMDFFDTSPKNRRRFLDIEGSKCTQPLVEALFNYNRLLKERNTYLKHNNPEEEYIVSLDHQLTTAQIEIIRFREEFIEFLNQQLTDIYQKLSSEEANIDVKYETVYDLEETDREKHIMSVIQQSRKKDLLYRLSHVGVHRDDMIVQFDGRNVEEYASQGQKRLLIISIKLALVKYIQKTKNISPILLLDDVFSEIDQQRRETFLRCMPKDIQTIVTTTDLSDIQTIDRNHMMIYQVDQNSVIKGFSE